MLCSIIGCCQLCLSQLTDSHIHQSKDQLSGGLAYLSSIGEDSPSWPSFEIASGIGVVVGKLLSPVLYLLYFDLFCCHVFLCAGTVWQVSEEELRSVVKETIQAEETRVQEDRCSPPRHQLEMAAC